MDWVHIKSHPGDATHGPCDIAYVYVHATETLGILISL